MTRSEYNRLGRILGGRDALAGVISWWKSKAPKRRSVSPRKIEKKAKKLSKRGQTAEIRAAVMARAGGLCEERYHGLRGCNGAADEMDHWLGGSGRRLQKQSVENCWALCWNHHVYRQQGRPSAEWWNERFREHCKRFGYPFVPHIEHQPLPPASLTHPSPPTDSVGLVGGEPKGETP